MLFVYWEDVLGEQRHVPSYILWATSSWVFYGVATKANFAGRLAFLRVFVVAAGGPVFCCVLGSIPRTVEQPKIETKDVKIGAGKIRRTNGRFFFRFWVSSWGFVCVDGLKGGEVVYCLFFCRFASRLWLSQVLSFFTVWSSARVRFGFYSCFELWKVVLGEQRQIFGRIAGDRTGYFLLYSPWRILL